MIGQTTSVSSELRAYAESLGTDAAGLPAARQRRPM